MRNRAAARSDVRGGPQFLVAPQVDVRCRKLACEPAAVTFGPSLNTATIGSAAFQQGSSRSTGLAGVSFAASLRSLTIGMNAFAHGATPAASGGSSGGSTTTDGGSLAYTGADQVLPALLFAGLLLLAGLTLRLASRRRRD